MRRAYWAVFAVMLAASAANPSWLLIAAMWVVTPPVAVGLLSLIERLSGAYLVRWINGSTLAWDPDDNREREDVR